MRSWIRIVAAVVVTGCLVAALQAGAGLQGSKYAAILGMWDAQTEDGIYTFEFEFAYRNDELVGKYHGLSGTRDMLNLTFEDGLLRFNVDVNGMLLYFVATVDKDKLSGMISLQYGDANIIGTKRKKSNYGVPIILGGS
jgi:hypothetical protein